MVVQIDPGTLMLARVFLGLALAVALTLGICAPRNPAAAASVRTLPDTSSKSAYRSGN